jgi:predicted GTPase
MRQVMSKIKNLFVILSALSAGRWGIFMLSSILPILTMVGFCLFLAIKYDYVLWLSVALILSTSIISVPLLLINLFAKRSEALIDIDANEMVKDSLVKASVDWSQHEINIWNDCRRHSRQLLATEREWSELDQVSLNVFSTVATAFNKKMLDFTIIEALQLVEEVSKRYKKVLKQEVPLTELITLSYIKSGYRFYDKYEQTGIKLWNVLSQANHIKNAFINQPKLVIDLINQQLRSTITTGVLSSMQHQAKVALLDEITSVAIDLYSGRFSFEEVELKESSIATNDNKRIAAELEPIRIVMAGQLSAGKSSIINMLNEQLVAEVDVLPSTDTTTVYEAKLDESVIRLVDLKGLDGSDETEDNMLLEMTHADLVIWVLKANQPARDLDKKLKAKFDSYYANSKNISRKKPKIICVVNQVDRLKPINDWAPPYDLNDSINPKVAVINKAMSFNQAILLPDNILALSVGDDIEPFGTDALKQLLANEIMSASNVQRNRQRVEKMNEGTSVTKQVKKVFTASKRLIP